MLLSDKGHQNDDGVDESKYRPLYIPRTNRHAYNMEYLIRWGKLWTSRPKLE